MLKNKLRNFLRKLFRVKKKENILDAFNRYRVNYIDKKIFKVKFNSQEILAALKEIDICEGDTLMIHASWRNFYNYNNTPEHFINILLDLVGRKGTICMPSYSYNRELFNVQESPSAAGVLSEVFRTAFPVTRSACTHFSIASMGYYAEKITSDHYKSKYGFDINSAYYKFSKVENSKVLFLGLGSYPSKLSLLHSASYILRSYNSKQREFYKENNYKSTLIDNNQIIVKNMVGINKKFKNNNKIFKRIVRDCKSYKSTKISNVDLVVIDSKEAFNKTIELIKNGETIYKKIT